MQLNNDQEHAYKEFINFLISDEKYFILSGAAGTGKTTLLNHVSWNGLNDYEDYCKLLGVPSIKYTPMFTATTNKAAEVLIQVLKTPAQTIHSFLRLKVHENYKTGKTDLIKRDDYIVHSNKLLFIDECSQIDRELAQIINDSTLNCKVVLIGDHCQLAPVFEKISSIYNHNYPFVELKTPVRNADQPALMALCNQLRETVETGVFHPIKLVPGVIEHLSGPEMQHHVETVFSNPDNNSRILCWSNNVVKAYNEHIRYVRGYGKFFEPGEKLVSASAYAVNGIRLNIEQEITVDSVNTTPYEYGTDKIKYYTIHSNLGKTNIIIPYDSVQYAAALNNYKRSKNWRAYYDLKNMFADLRPRDACTVYKAQGSTYDTAYVDLSDISECRQVDQVARMLYVAASRPKTKLYLYGKLKPAYGGVL